MDGVSRICVSDIKRDRGVVKMNRKEFLMYLENGLEGLDYDVRHDILNEFDVHIRQGVETGLSEAEVVNSLGDPDDIIAELISNENVMEKEAKERQHFQTEESMGRKEPIIVERNTKDVNGSVNPDAINHIDIQVRNCTVVLIKGDALSMQYSSYGENHELKPIVRNDTMYIHIENEEKPDKRVMSASERISTTVNRAMSKSHTRNDVIAITWPNALSSLLVHTEYGSIRVTDLTVERLELKSELGSAFIQNIRGNTFNLHSEVGSVTMVHSTCENLTASSEMGKVQLESVDAKHYDCNTEMGVVKAISINPHANGRFYTKMGSCKVSFKEKPTHTKIITKTNMGSVSNPYERQTSESQNFEYVMEFGTNMGSVRIG